ncbi:hypothetical protein RHGRI_025608 [Rhododendron griersonianum]|uniref:HhH-GPD domain-containing protein n=1 Tax=Rhododendron griersonianum TaxID=479676 RepID=A0AAV6IPL5_9ERIC|nr:hypothetical protein RHGRI_025608 [Rhododendron griersonianum]
MIDLQKAIDALSTLPGFGPKVAACIALFSLDQHQAIPVDTHVWQIATRYLIPELAGTRLTPKLCSRAVFSLRFESGKDVSDFVKDITSWFSAKKENLEIYLDHSGDPMMEHFGDQQEQVSISIDQNEIPISDSEDDSFSSSVFEEFGIFKRNGLAVIEEGSTCYKVINGCIARGMGKDRNVAAVHKIPWSGPNGRLEAFRISSTEMV